MTNYNNKYLKYKNKYFKLKSIGGYALSQECNAYGIEPETDPAENNPLFFYPRIKEYFKNNKNFYSDNLKKINDFSKNKQINSTNIKEIIDFFENDNEHINILKELFSKYICDELQNYHVQFTSLIFLSFILELEMFMIYNCIVPYNTINNPNNNNIFFRWEYFTTETLIYDKLIDEDIENLFKYFTCSLEQKYKVFVESVISRFMSEKPAYRNNIKKSFYKDEYNNDYRHIHNDWINKLLNLGIFDIHIITEIINEELREFEKFYYASSTGLFDHIFMKENYGNCETFTILEFYFLSRFHINPNELYLDLETATKWRHPILITLQNQLNISCHHWSCTYMDTTTRNSFNQKTTYSVKEKNEILFSFIFGQYDNYLYLMRSHFYFYKSPDTKLVIEFIKKRQQFIKDIIIIFKQDILTNKISTYADEAYKLTFKAVENNGLSLEYIYTKFKDDYYVVKTAVNNNGLALQYASLQLQDDPDIVKIAVNNNGLALQYTSLRLQDVSDIVKIAVNKNGLALLHASLRLQDDSDIVKIAVNENGLALKYASRRLQDDPEIVIIAVNKNGLALLYASQRLQDNPDIVIIAVNGNELALKYASQRLQDDLDTVKPAVNNNILKDTKKFDEFGLINDKYIFALEKVKENGLYLQYVDKELQYFDVVEYAVQNNGLALEYAVEEFKKNYIIVVDAIKNNLLAFKYVDDSLLMNHRFMFEAVKINGLSLQYAIPKYKLDYEIVSMAVKNNGLALQYVDYKCILYKYIVKMAVKSNGLALQYSDPTLKSNFDVVKIAVMMNGLALQYANDNLKSNSQIVKYAVFNNGLALQYANSRYISDYQIVKIAVTQNGLALQYASPTLKTNADIVKIAVTQNGLALQYATKELQDDKTIVSIAVSNIRSALQYASSTLKERFYKLLFL